MAWRRSDLPLHGDPAARFLPWILGFLVYLSALMVGCSLMIDQLADNWRTSLAGNLTVELPIDPTLGTKARADRLDAVIDLITATPGVTGATVLEHAELERLLRPWLGDTVGELDVALPTMIAVTAHQDAVIDRADLRNRLTAIVPDTRIDDHGDWVDDALHFLRSMQALAVFLVILVLTTAAATVIFVTRTGLAVHQPVIEILHLVGAQDSYIARQFQTQSLRVSLMGGIIGTALAVLTLIAMKPVLGSTVLDMADMGEDRGVMAGHGLMQGLTSGLGLTPWHWAALAILPLAMALLAMLTARWTVLRSINRSL
ncbi:cell division protein FtsX [Dongia soli]|uniref:FtsX-like permease family protein n=1 Tax=Dongia soli TaxID=600628 RepID=A0ABU5E6J2_9PROT|nr:FtsX-like permease family protein [Dongia soli]MDY0881255.1 FtsX-like permease family protein [Dongia soli]